MDVPVGDISVIPQPCMNSIPRDTNSAASERETGAPPHMIRLSELTSYRPSSSVIRRANTVGTPAAIVTRSLSTSSASASALVSRPGSTSFEPASAVV